MTILRLLQLIAFVFGAQEICHAAAYHKQKKPKWAIASLCVGLFACACAVISITGIL